MQKIIVRQISGKRSQQTDEFAVGNFKELLVGRDESAAIRFDPTGDDLVSRRHMQIIPDPHQADSFQAVDLQSRNGTFLNRQRLYAPARISHGDVIQLGPGGPEFRFELDPAPSSMARPTREVGAGGYSMQATREVSLQPPVAASDTPRPVGRATVERMLGESFNRVKGESKKTMWASLAASAVLLLIGLVFYLHLGSQAQANKVIAQQQEALLNQMDTQVQQQPTAMNSKLGQLEAQLKQNSEAGRQREQQLAHLIAQQASASKQAAGATPAQPGATQAQAAPVVRQPPAAQGNPYTQQVDAIQKIWGAGQHDQAMQALQQLIASNPERWEGFVVAGNYERQLGSFPDALLSYKQAKALAPAEKKAVFDPIINQLSTQLANGATNE